MSYPVTSASTYIIRDCVLTINRDGLVSLEQEGRIICAHVHFISKLCEAAIQKSSEFKAMSKQHCSWNYEVSYNILGILLTVGHGHALKISQNGNSIILSLNDIFELPEEIKKLEQKMEALVRSTEITSIVPNTNKPTVDVEPGHQSGGMVA